ncbi:MAG: hypothetical protein KJZ84_16860 [Bryobacteraceae bacterium]|nr:hypothetical protein [Bryobacteraceae bacterium]
MARLEKVVEGQAVAELFRQAAGARLQLALGIEQADGGETAAEIEANEGVEGSRGREGWFMLHSRWAAPLMQPLTSDCAAEPHHRPLRSRRSHPI